MRFPLVFALLISSAFGQFTLQQSNSNASFRGVHAVSDKVAWVSGTKGTVLRTTDGGEHWIACAIPSGAEKLDFRGVQAFDEKTAIAMSSGKGDASRLYKTIDGCKTWKMVFSNPDAEGFWDTIAFSTPQRGWLLGDPVDGSFSLFATYDGGLSWDHVRQAGLKAPAGGGGAFAASNSLVLPHLPLNFATTNGWIYQGNSNCTMTTNRKNPKACLDLFDFVKQQIPLASGGEATGIYSITEAGNVMIAVGGDYTKPNQREGTAAYSCDRGLSWKASNIPPRGYRSSVAGTNAGAILIAVGTTGADISRDFGRTWQALADGNWNAISMPYVVGPNGRIARIEPLVLSTSINGNRPVCR